MRLPARLRFKLPKRLPPWLRRWRPFASRRATRVQLSLLAFLVLLLSWWRCSGTDRPVWPREQILAAIRYVESGDRDPVPDGDGGKAIGPYQIHEVYWRDAVRTAPELGGRYQDCRQRAYAERVIDAYMRHYAAGAWQRGEAETIARVHNGGPQGPDKQATAGYWRRVRGRLP